MKQPDEPIGRRSRRRPASADVSHAVFDRTQSYRHLRNPFEPMKVFPPFTTRRSPCSKRRA
jgi:hypothetical protein